MTKVTAEPREPRYEEITNAIRRDLRSGVLEVGDPIASESEICATFDVSRHTAREAVRRLEELGLVARRKGSATRVVAIEPRVQFGVSINSDADVLQYARHTVLDTRSTWAPVQDRVASELELGASRKWRSIDAVRRTDGTAVGLATICVSSIAGNHLDAVEVPGGKAVFEQLVQALRLKNVTIDQEIYASALSPRAARRLRASAGEPSLVVIRRFTANDVGCFEVSRTVHPADRFRYRQTLVATAPTI